MSIKSLKSIPHKYKKIATVCLLQPSSSSQFTLEGREEAGGDDDEESVHGPVEESGKKKKPRRDMCDLLSEMIEDNRRKDRETEAKVL